MHRFLQAGSHGRQHAPSSFLNASLAAFHSGPSSSVRTRMVSTIRYMMLSNTLQQQRESENLFLNCQLTMEAEKRGRGLKCGAGWRPELGAVGKRDGGFPHGAAARLVVASGGG